MGFIVKVLMITICFNARGVFCSSNKQCFFIIACVHKKTQKLRYFGRQSVRLHVQLSAPF